MAIATSISFQDAISAEVTRSHRIPDAFCLPDLLKLVLSAIVLREEVSALNSAQNLGVTVPRVIATELLNSKLGIYTETRSEGGDPNLLGGSVGPLTTPSAIALASFIETVVLGLADNIDISTDTAEEPGTQQVTQSPSGDSLPAGADVPPPADEPIVSDEELTSFTSQFPPHPSLLSMRSKANFGSLTISQLLQMACVFHLDTSEDSSKQTPTDRLKAKLMATATATALARIVRFILIGDEHRQLTPKDRQVLASNVAPILNKHLSSPPQGRQSGGTSFGLTSSLLAAEVVSIVDSLVAEEEAKTLATTEAQRPSASIVALSKAHSNASSAFSNDHSLLEAFAVSLASALSGSTIESNSLVVTHRPRVPITQRTHIGVQLAHDWLRVHESQPSLSSEGGGLVRPQEAAVLRSHISALEDVLVQGAEFANAKMAEAAEGNLQHRTDISDNLDDEVNMPSRELQVDAAYNVLGQLLLKTNSNDSTSVEDGTSTSTAATVASAYNCQPIIAALSVYGSMAPVMPHVAAAMQALLMDKALPLAAMLLYSRQLFWNPAEAEADPTSPLRSVVGPYLTHVSSVVDAAAMPPTDKYPFHDATSGLVSCFDLWISPLLLSNAASSELVHLAPSHAVEVVTLLTRYIQTAAVVAKASPESAAKLEGTVRKAAQIGFAVSPKQPAAARPTHNQLAPQQIPPSSIALLDAYATFMITSIKAIPIPPSPSPSAPSAAAPFLDSGFKACSALIKRHMPVTSTTTPTPNLWEVLPPLAAETGKLVSNLTLLVAAATSASQSPIRTTFSFDYLIDTATKLAQRGGGLATRPTPIQISAAAMSELKLHAITTQGTEWQRRLEGVALLGDSGFVSASDHVRTTEPQPVIADIRGGLGNVKSSASEAGPNNLSALAELDRGFAILMKSAGMPSPIGAASLSPSAGTVWVALMTQATQYCSPNFEVTRNPLLPQHFDTITSAMLISVKQSFNAQASLLQATLTNTDQRLASAHPVVYVGEHAPELLTQRHSGTISDSDQGQPLLPFQEGAARFTPPVAKLGTLLRWVSEDLPRDENTLPILRTILSQLFLTAELQLVSSDTPGQVLAALFSRPLEGTFDQDAHVFISTKVLPSIAASTSSAPEDEAIAAGTLPWRTVLLSLFPKALALITESLKNSKESEPMNNEIEAVVRSVASLCDRALTFSDRLHHLVTTSSVIGASPTTQQLLDHQQLKHQCLKRLALEKAIVISSVVDVMKALIARHVLPAAPLRVSIQTIFYSLNSPSPLLSRLLLPIAKSPSRFADAVKVAGWLWVRPTGALEGDKAIARTSLKEIVFAATATARKVSVPPQSKASTAPAQLSGDEAFAATTKELETVMVPVHQHVLSALFTDSGPLPVQSQAQLMSEVTEGTLFAIISVAGGAPLTPSPPPTAAIINSCSSQDEEFMLSNPAALGAYEGTISALLRPKVSGEDTSLLTTVEGLREGLQQAATLGDGEVAAAVSVLKDLVDRVDALVVTLSERSRSTPPTQSAGLLLAMSGCVDVLLGLTELTAEHKSTAPADEQLSLLLVRVHNLAAHLVEGGASYSLLLEPLSRLRLKEVARISQGLQQPTPSNSNNKYSAM
eukprot:GILJ01016163.1.p1 GENE.GILJ01016163.1~~GILJ01016163.1.p1  ORF type:complete len:1672 (+),score=249.11 GILJ01016163.1:209-5017(+)